MIPRHSRHITEHKLRDDVRDPYRRILYRSGCLAFTLNQPCHTINRATSAPTILIPALKSDGRPVISSYPSARTTPELTRKCTVRPSSDDTSEHGACLAPGCLEPLVRARPLAFQESDGLGGGGAGHRGAVGRHRQLERPRPVTCKAASRGMSRRPSRFSHEGRYRSHGGRHMPAAATIT